MSIRAKLLNLAVDSGIVGILDDLLSDGDGPINPSAMVPEGDLRTELEGIMRPVAVDEDAKVMHLRFDDSADVPSPEDASDTAEVPARHLARIVRKAAK